MGSTDPSKDTETCSATAPGTMVSTGSTVQSLLLEYKGTRRSVEIPENINVDHYTDLTPFAQQGRGKLERLHDWLLFDDTFLLYGWRDGKGGFENRHELPPPIESELYFGDLLVLRLNDNGKLEGLGEEEFEAFLTHLMGGFTDLESEGEEEVVIEEGESEDDDSGDAEYVPGGSVSESSESDSEMSSGVSDLSDQLEEEPIEDSDMKVWGGRKYVADSASDKDMSTDEEV